MTRLLGFSPGSPRCLHLSKAPRLQFIIALGDCSLGRLGGRNLLCAFAVGLGISSLWGIRLITLALLSAVRVVC